MTRREELLELRDSMDIAREEFEENYAQLEEEIENTCDCDCSDECDGEDYDDMVTIAETETDCLGIVVSEDEYGERFVLIQDTVDGDRVELNEKELAVIVAMMGL